MTNSTLTQTASPFALTRAANPGLGQSAVMRILCEQVLDEAEAVVPVRVELLASLCGIAAVEQHAAGPSGMLIPRVGRLVASTLATDGHERRRFTVLHEAGHALAPELGLSCGAPDSHAEALFDIAASELLMPRRFFAADLMDAPPGLAGVEAFAFRYQASVTACAIRAVDLARRPALLLVLREMKKPTDAASAVPRLRLAWARSRGAWPYLRRFKSVTTDSPFARAWRHEEVDELGFLGDPLAETAGPVSISARRYGDQVLALAHQAD
jgi:hypothetical protein